MIKSYLMFTERHGLKKRLITAAVLITVIIEAEIFAVNYEGAEWVGIGIKAFANWFCMCCFPVLSLVFPMQIYIANTPGQGGYKYFHSVGNSAERYEKAILFSNIIALAISLVAAGISLIFNSTYEASMIIFSAFALGIMNFAGHSRNIVFKIIPFVLFGMAYGFMSGIEEMQSEAVTAVGIIAGAVYMGGLVYALLRAKSAWEREDGKPVKENVTASKSADNIPAKKIKEKHVSMRLLLGFFRRYPFAAVVFPVFEIVLTAISFIFNEPLGSEDYLMPKLFLLYPGLFMSIIIIVLMYGELGANKLIRSMPIAKRLFTRALPLLISAMIIGLQAAVIIAYMIFLAVTGQGVSHFSDTLVVGSVYCFGAAVFAPFTVGNSLSGGGKVMGALLIYIFMPFLMIITLGDEVLSTGGFGVALPVAAVMFIGVAALGTYWIFYICSKNYRSEKSLPQSVNISY